MVTIATMVSYTGYTIVTTQWRLPFRKEMNMADNAAASTATDSLLNVEAVQQFNNQDLVSTFANLRKLKNTTSHSNFMK
jgi:ABC transporter ATM